MRWLVVSLVFVFIVLIVGFVNYHYYSDGDSVVELRVGRASQGVSSFAGEEGGSNVSRGSARVYDGDREWDWRIVELDELMVNLTFFIQPDNSTILQVYPYSVNEARTNNGAYRWRARLNISGTVTEVAGNLNKNQLNKYYNFTIPANIWEFSLLIGESSTLIDFSATNDATRWNPAENICKQSNGTLVTCYAGGGSDLWCGYSDDNGSTWNTAEILAGTVDDVNIICKPDDTLQVSYLTGSDTYAHNSTNPLSGWTSAYLVSSYSTFLNNAGVTGSDGHTHYCAGTSTAYPVYTNDTIFGSEETIGVFGSRYCDIEVDSYNNPYIVMMVDNATNDYLALLSPTLDGGWGANITISSNVSYSFGELPAIAIRNVSGVDKIVVTGTTNSFNHLLICNSTTTHIENWDCATPGLTTGYNSDPTITDTGRIEVLYTKAVSVDNLIYRANSTDGVNWALDQTLEAGPNVNYPSVADSHFPKWNRISDIGEPVHFVVTYISGSDVYYSNYTFSAYVDTSTDEQAPTFSGLSVLPINNSVYSFGQSYFFNSTWSDNVGVSTILFNFEGVNYTTTHLGGGVYNKTISELGVGSYSYQWFGNDTNGNQNQTGLFTYDVTKTSLSVLVNSTGSFTVTYPTEVSVGFSESNGGDADVVYTLYKNGSNISQGEVVTPGVGSYLYIVNSSGGQNYTGSVELDRQVLNVTQGASTVYAFVNGTRSSKTIEFESGIRLNATRQVGAGNISLYINTTLLNTSDVLNTVSVFYNFTQPGSYLITSNNTNTQNYSSNSESFVVTVTNSSSPADTLPPMYSSAEQNPSSPTTYSAGKTYQFNISWTDDSAISTALLSFNGTNYSMTNFGSEYSYTFTDLTPGSYSYYYWANDTSGNQNFTMSGTYTINKASPSLSLGFSPSSSVTEGTETTVTGSGCVGTLSCNLYRNGTNVSNPDVATLGVGTYTYFYNTSGNLNYSSASTNNNLIVSSAPTPFNGTSRFLFRNTLDTLVAWIDGSGNMSLNGFVNASTFCLLGNCISSWSEINLTGSGGGQSSGWFNITTQTITPMIANISSGELWIGEAKLNYSDGALHIW